MKYIDLHTHTHYSDGITSPAELVKAAKLRGLDILAKTDHDTIQGYKEAEKEARRWDLIFIPGAEFTTKDYHILGLGFDTHNPQILAMLEKSRLLQRETASNRVDLMKESGVPINIELVEHYFPDARIGKYNILMTLLLDQELRSWIYQRHENASPEDLMNCYLRKNGIAANVEKPALSPEEVIQTVHQAGGLAILAHPALDVDSIEEVDLLREQGIDGLEIQLNFYDQGYPAYEDYAAKHKLLLTYGSDYHGANFNRPLLARGKNVASEELENILINSYRRQNESRQLCGCPY